jgi:hypothetical protein
MPCSVTADNVGGTHTDIGICTKEALLHRAASGDVLDIDDVLGADANSWVINMVSVQFGGHVVAGHAPCSAQHQLTWDAECRPHPRALTP